MELVFPKNNEAELVAQAEQLGTEIILCYKEIPKKTFGKTAILVTERKQISKYKNKCDLLLGPPTRDMFEDKRIDGIIGLGLEPRKDHTHYRRSLTQVEAELAKKQEKFLFYNLADYHASKKPAELLGRWMQDKKVLKKKKIAGLVVSGASTALDMRDEAARQAVWDVL